MMARVDLPAVPNVVRFATRPLTFIGQRLLTIFHDSPSWAEVSSAAMMLLHCYMLLMSPRAPDQWVSLGALTEMLPGYQWAAISGAGGLIQLFGVLLQWRFLRGAGAIVAMLWLGVIIAFTAEQLPGWPHLSFMIAWLVPNFFVMARHSRDWRL